MSDTITALLKLPVDNGPFKTPNVVFSSFLS